MAALVVHDQEKPRRRTRRAQQRRLVDRLARRTRVVRDDPQHAPAGPRQRLAPLGRGARAALDPARRRPPTAERRFGLRVDHGDICLRGDVEGEAGERAAARADDPHRAWREAGKLVARDRAHRHPPQKIRRSGRWADDPSL
jgi:hypothetical protein